MQGPCRRRLVAGVAFAWLTVAAAHAQATNEFDFEPTTLAINTITPNGATHQITTSVTYTGQHLELNAPLTVRAGGELRLVRSVLKVRGNILLEERGRITVIDSALLLPNTFHQQYVWRIEGGLLHTERSTVGGGYVGSSLSQTRLLHLRGTWLARQTVVQGMVTLLSDGRNGWFGNPAWKGGSVFAMGLYEGDRADAIHMSGMGDASLINGTMNVGLYYDAAATQPGSATIDLSSRVPLALVYGDPAVHSGVTAAIARLPYRLEFQNHRSPTWQFFAVNASQGAPLQTLTLRNAEGVTCNFRGSNLVGSPVLGGPWASYYSVLPGLPSTTRPGHHALPPGCSVRLGNVQFQSGSGPNDWNRIGSWGLYASGLATNLTVTGPTLFAELQLTDGQMQLNGVGSFDMGVFANTVSLYQTASLSITNASLGDLSIGLSTTGLIEAHNSSLCTLNQVRSGPLRLRTTNGAATITAQNVFGGQNLIVDTAGGGSVQVIQASPAQSFDLQNLGFESALLAGGVPANWASTSSNGSLVADVASGAPGANSYAFTANANSAAISKQLLLPPETTVSLIGAAKVTQAPASGQLLMRVSQGVNTASKAFGNATIGWQRGQVPTFTTGFTVAPVITQFLATGSPATVRLDDFQIQLGSWWDPDNLGNLAFEGAYRHQGKAPTYSAAPDCWRSFRVACLPDTGVLRPGTSGAQSLKVTLQGTSGNVYKMLTFLRGGETVDISGWARGTGGAGANQQIVVGNGDNFAVVAPPNQFSGPLPCDGTWRSFTVTYVVPPNPSYTRLDLGTFGAVGNEAWFDDLTVSIRLQ